MGLKTVAPVAIDDSRLDWVKPKLEALEMISTNGMMQNAPIDQMTGLGRTGMMVDS